jgi:hypothetical protein
MTTIAEMKTAIGLAFTSVDYATVWRDVPPANDDLPATGLKSLWCHARSVEDGVITARQLFRLFTTGTGLDEDPCFCDSFSPVESDKRRFARLVREWCAARVVAGWFVNITHWGEECALGWGINELAVVKTAKFVWETSEKLAILPVLGVPVPGAPEVV